MKTSKDIPLLRKDSIIYGVLDRNEAINGTGIPNKKRGKEISLCFSNYLESPHLPIIKLNNGLTIALTKK